MFILIMVLAQANESGSPTEGAKTLQAFKEKAKVAKTPSLSPANLLPVGGLRKTNIEVGPAGTFTFSPANITSLVGEVLSFAFNPKVCS